MLAPSEEAVEEEEVVEAVFEEEEEAASRLGESLEAPGGLPTPLSVLKKAEEEGEEGQVRDAPIQGGKHCHAVLLFKYQFTYVRS